MARNEGESADDAEPELPGSSMTDALETLGAVEPTTVETELGVTPAECLVQLVREQGGRLSQEELVGIVPWSPATVSRLLTGLEEERAVLRIPSGPGNVVLLPDETPDGLETGER